jgi:transcriptional regulator with XRE-family HTH domain
MAATIDGRVRLGARLRHARESSRLSLGEVAERSGVTKSFLSRVERDETSPSVASLVGICNAVGLSMADLFQVPQTTLVRRADRPTLADLPKHADVVDTLITPAGERHVTVLESTVAPGGSGGSVLYTLPSECEVCFVLQGTIEVQVEGETFTLKQGDALTFGAAVPHTWRSVGSDGARILWVLAPALPDPRRAVR